MSETQLEFGKSEWLTMGVELELQLIDRRTGDLTRGASDLIALVTRQPFPGDVKPEITESMLEISTSIQHAFGPMRDQLVAMRDTLVVGADRLDLEIAGGGTHPFQRWYDRQIYDRPRFRHVAGLYGYLAKQFTVFGQHVHIGCENGTQALWLLHRLSAYIPQFIALAASSPYFQGVDTSYDCSRLNSVYAFPLSGRAPFLTDWPAFERFFGKLRSLGVVESMKDFYWDIRPKPEFGTIEVRVFDTPLVGGARCGTRRLRAGHLPDAPRASDAAGERGHLHHLQLQPLPGVPVRTRGPVDRRCLRRGASGASGSACHAGAGAPARARTRIAHGHGRDRTLGSLGRQRRPLATRDVSEPPLDGGTRTALCRAISRRSAAAIGSPPEAPLRAGTL